MAGCCTMTAGCMGDCVRRVTEALVWKGMSLAGFVQGCARDLAQRLVCYAEAGSVVQLCVMDVGTGDVVFRRRVPLLTSLLWKPVDRWWEGEAMRASLADQRGTAPADPPAEPSSPSSPLLRRRLVYVTRGLDVSGKPWTVASNSLNDVIYKTRLWRDNRDRAHGVVHHRQRTEPTVINYLFSSDHNHGLVADRACHFEISVRGAGVGVGADAGGAAGDGAAAGGGGELDATDFYNELAESEVGVARALNRHAWDSESSVRIRADHLLRCLGYGARASGAFLILESDLDEVRIGEEDFVPFLASAVVTSRKKNDE